MAQGNTGNWKPLKKSYHPPKYLVENNIITWYYCNGKID
jgi:hypothetical protein